MYVHALIDSSLVKNCRMASRTSTGVTSPGCSRSRPTNAASFASTSLASKIVRSVLDSAIVVPHLGELVVKVGDIVVVPSGFLGHFLALGGFLALVRLATYARQP